jgi:hypothetical protein
LEPHGPIANALRVFPENQRGSLDVSVLLSRLGEHILAQVSDGRQVTEVFSGVAAARTDGQGLALAGIEGALAFRQA